METERPGSHNGTLYVVGTPIGNLEDLTFRARRVLQAAHLVAAEDTRTAKVLLAHHDVATPLTSYHEHNESTRTPQLIQHLKRGRHIALITDAGTPAISDPGYRLVLEAHRHHIPVVGIPGPSAVVTALSIAGLPTDRFLFLGFLPPRRQRRKTLLERVAEEPGTLVAYESPHRIADTLRDVAAVLPGREVVVTREMTKRHEEVLRGLPDEVARALGTDEPRRVRGEITLLIAGAGHRKPRRAPHRDDRPRGMKRVARQVAEWLGLPARDVYAALVEVRKAHDREAEAPDRDTDDPAGRDRRERAAPAPHQNVDVNHTP